MRQTVCANNQFTEDGSISEVTVIGIDLAKNVFELAGQNRGGRIIYRKRVRRSKLLETVAQLPSCLIAMEACGGSHHWAREFAALGHRVRLLPAQYVKPYRVGPKNDRRDAEAVCEAATRSQVPEVAVKTRNQQAMQGLHRVRSQLVGQQTALSNCARGLLQEFGIAVPRGRAPLRRALAEILAGPNLPEDLVVALQAIAEQLRELAERTGQLTARIEQAARADERHRTLLSARGVGPITVTAFTATIGDPSAYANGRQVAAAIGLVPAQNSSGDRERLLGISKRGDRYLRSLLVHGARSALKAARGKSDPLSRWMCRPADRRGHNKAVVAIANKTARILWAMMKSGESFAPERAVAV